MYKTFFEENRVFFYVFYSYSNVLKSYSSTVYMTKD